MCGIAGIISPYPRFVDREKVQIMTNTLSHRGPDGEGFWMNENNSVCLGHRRLAVIDTTNAAAQPFNYMHYTLIFNGEIYNYLELKETLLQKGYRFTTQSDSEVIPAAFDYWGKECLHQFDGMFAFALYDSRTKEIWIARDRFGEKPIYYYTEYEERGKFKQLLFASEMKALWSVGVPKLLNGTMMLNYISLGYTQNPIKNTQTFYSNILTLPAGYYLSIKPEQGKIQIKKWYTLPLLSYSPANNTVSPSIYEEFLQLFTTSIKRRLRSDVAVGTSLSGGLDSASIAAILLHQNLHSLSTFSAIFPGFEQDESRYITAFKDYYNNTQFNSHFITPTADDFINNWQKVQYHQEEPLQSSSVFTQFMVYKLAKEQGVTVLLDGQGADEVLGGYKKYTHWHLQYLLRNNYSSFRKEKKLFIKNEFVDQWDYKNYIAAFFPTQTSKRLQANTIKQQQHIPYLNKEFYRQYHNESTLIKPEINNLEDILYYNTFTQGLQELLRYADRNSMANSREVRLPFLNHQLVAFLFSLPSSFKMKDGFTKHILRKSMEDKLPANIAWRKGKVGYEPPQKQWMQHPSIIELIHESRKKLVSKNILDHRVLTSTLEPKNAHDANNYDWRILSAAALWM